MFTCWQTCGHFNIVSNKSQEKTAKKVLFWPFWASAEGAPFRCTHGFAAYSFVFWFNHATDAFPAMLTFPLENQVFAIHFCGLEDDWYRAETSAAENTVEDLLLRPFGYFLPPESGLWCEWISGFAALPIFPTIQYPKPQFPPIKFVPREAYLVYGFRSPDAFAFSDRK